MQVAIFGGVNAVPAPYTTRQCDVGHRRCGCRSRRHGNQLRFWRCWRVRHGRVVFVIVRFFCHAPHQQALLGRLRRDALGEEFVAGVECRGLFDVVAVDARFLSQRSVTARPAHSAEDCRRHALFMTMSVERAVEDRAGRRRGRLRLDAALDTADDGQVAGLLVRRAVQRDELQHDMGKMAKSQRRIHACPSLLGSSTSSRVAANCRSVVVLAQPFSDVTWRVCSGQGCSGKNGVCLARVHDLHQTCPSGPR